eukprot:7239385-Lingulodinium_polyedra.AAC.1
MLSAANRAVMPLGGAGPVADPPAIPPVRENPNVGRNSGNGGIGQRSWFPDHPGHSRPAEQPPGPR